jgi:hypothetical protein
LLKENDDVNRAAILEVAAVAGRIKMYCSNPDCRAELSADDLYCRRCGTEVDRQAADQGLPDSQSINTRDNLSGNIIQAGRDVHFTNHTAEEEVATYEPKWSWKSPLTLAALSWISVALGILSLVSGWQGIGSLISFFKSGPSKQLPSYGWLISFGATVILLLLFMELRRITKLRTQHFSAWPFLPSITGWGGKIGLAKLQGKCPKCDGNLKFYNRPTEWVTEHPSGRTRVSKRTAAAECSRNPDHWWTVDRTDGE